MGKIARRTKRTTAVARGNKIEHRWKRKKRKVHHTTGERHDSNLSQGDELGFNRTLGNRLPGDAAAFERSTGNRRTAGERTEEQTAGGTSENQTMFNWLVTDHIQEEWMTQDAVQGNRTTGNRTQGAGSRAEGKRTRGGRTEANRTSGSLSQGGGNTGFN